MGVIIISFRQTSNWIPTVELPLHMLALGFMVLGLVQTVVIYYLLQRSQSPDVNSHHVPPVRTRAELPQVEQTEPHPDPEPQPRLRYVRVPPKEVYMSSTSSKCFHLKNNCGHIKHIDRPKIITRCKDCPSDCYSY